MENSVEISIISSPSVIIQLILSLFCLSANTLIILTRKKLNHISQATQSFLTNIAVTDVLMGVVLVLRVVLLVSGGDSAFCPTLLVSAALLAFETEYGIFLLNIESLMAVGFATKFKQIFTKRAVYLFISSGWFVGTCVSLSMLLFFQKEMPMNDCYMVNPILDSRWAQVFVGLVILGLFGNLGIQSLTMVLAKKALASINHTNDNRTDQPLPNVSAKLEVNAQGKTHNVDLLSTKTASTKPGELSNLVVPSGAGTRISPVASDNHLAEATNQPSTSNTGTMKPKKQGFRKHLAAVIRIELCMTICFLVCYGPFLFTTFALTFCTDDSSCAAKRNILSYLSVALTLNSTTNLFIYFFYNKKFWHASKKLLTCKK